MRLLLFISKVSFICNICYVLSVVGRYFNLEQIHDSVKNTVIILGFIAVFINALVNLLWIFSLIIGKKSVPLWLGIANFLFLIFQIVNSFFLEL